MTTGTRLAAPVRLLALGELAAMGATPVAGSPSVLVAHRERIELSTTMNDAEAGTREATALAAVLRDGRLRMDRATFDFYSAFALAPLVPEHALALAEAVHASWPLLQQQPSGRAASTGEGRAFAAVWRRTPARAAAIVGSIDAVMASTGVVVESLDVHLALQDSSGRPAWGALPAGGDRFVRTSRETGLPWTLQVAPRDPAGARAVTALRSNLLASGFGLMALVIATAGYLMFRSVNRELGVARLQADCPPPREALHSWHL